MRCARTLALVLLCMSIAVGCERQPIRGTPLESTASRRVVHLRTITQLLPNRPTHVAVDRLGQIFWVQEDESGQDVLFMIGEGGIPRGTRLTSSNVVDALHQFGDVAGTGRASGQIRSIVAAEGGVYFYFYGFKGDTPKACLGLYQPQAGRIRILADTRRVEAATGMGRSMQLARATMINTAGRVWVWLRHSDISSFLTFDPRILGAVVLPELEVPFRQIVSDYRPVRLGGNDAELSAAGEGLLLMDIDAAMLWQVGLNGEATVRYSLIGLPKQLSPPTVSDGRILIFAGDSDSIGTELQIVMRQDLKKFTYPALLELDGSDLRAIERDELRAHAGFPVYSVRLTRLVPESPGQWISYDAASGALMRVRIEDRP